ncbi:hypothetical protein DPX16_15949 [Anabarilius grahami]|uniref:Chemokine interleukin-8-like domain-containing protein n=1 Tax=Anabarilius grahami TaxID=495550 RepID=A0A3N0YTU5_ANAGA|nr:hypothetical protein DPX16_15949 [Anabarilius grahami]
MALRTLRSNISLLLLLLVCLHFTTEKSTAAISSREKCECIEEAGSVQWRKITDYKIIEKYPLCNKVQIILQLSGKEVCLNPKSKQGKKLQRCWKRSAMLLLHVKECSETLVRSNCSFIGKSNINVVCDAKGKNTCKIQQKQGTRESAQKCRVTTTETR